MDERIANHSPRVIQRQCGGWLAISPDGNSLQIGVIADSEGDAKDLFALTENRWKEILESEHQEGAVVIGSPIRQVDG